MRKLKTVPEDYEVATSIIYSVVEGLYLCDDIDIDHDNKIIEISSEYKHLLGDNGKWNW